jgi:hypothetical protein
VKRKSRKPKRRKIWFLILFLGLAGTVWVAQESRKVLKLATAGAILPLPPATLRALCALRTNALAQCDIALMNLLCAQGVPGAEKLDIAAALKLLDQFAKHVAAETDRHLYRFRKNPVAFGRSEANFRMQMLGTVLAEDVGVHYNPERISGPGPDEEPADKFSPIRKMFSFTA